MLDNITIKKKLDFIRNYLTELEPYLIHDNEAIKKDTSLLRPIERLFQLITDAAIDINTSIISSLELEGPNDYAGTFTIVARSKVFPFDFGEKISKSVGLRNQIIHQYEKVDIDRMLNDIKSNISDYIQYIKYINDFVQKNDK